MRIIQGLISMRLNNLIILTTFNTDVMHLFTAGSRREKGREYLENAWRLTQTEPDKDKLRDKFGG